MKLKLDKSNVLVFLILFLSSSYTICNNRWSSGATIALWLLCTGILFSNSHTVYYSPLFVSIILVVCMAITTLINGENIRSYLIVAYTYAVLVLFVSKVDLKSYIASYKDVMLFLCLISLLGYALFMFFPGLHHLLDGINNGDMSGTNLVLFAASKTHSRNMGMFWEPGAFQTFINLALLFEIIEPFPDKKKVAIYCLTNITTYSTTGYLAMALILLLPFFNKEVELKKKAMLLLGLLVACVVCLLSPTIRSFLFASSINGQSTVFGKIFNFFRKTEPSGVLTSADVRYNAVFEVWKAFTEQPFWGHGYDGLAIRMYPYTHGMNTCTFVDWFATYGVVYGTLSVIGVYLFAKKLVPQRVEVFYVVCILFVLTMGENYIHHGSIIVLLLYGYLPRKIIRSEELKSDSV